jgi:hypothetical protein
LKIIILSPSLLSSFNCFGLSENRKNGNKAMGRCWGEKMSALLRLEEKHDLLKNELAENLQKKHDLELQISQEFEELKGLEISLEKRMRDESGGARSKKTTRHP